MSTALETCDGDTHVFSDNGFPFCRCGRRMQMLPVPKEIPEHYGMTRASVGWECLKCGAVYAPSVQTCANCGPKYEKLEK